jgi:hypothetical protein
MAKRKIIWSRKAQKKLFAILESSIRSDKTKVFSADLFKAISKRVRLLKRNPETGIKTSDNSVYGVQIESFIILYGFTEKKVIIHTICRQPQNTK